MSKVKLDIIGLSYSQTQTGAYALVLGEVDGTRRLPIIIGGYEAQAIAIELEQMKPGRPLTHDLFKNFIDSVDAILTEVYIYKLIEGIFYSKVVFQIENKTIELDSRTSDAVALAVRTSAPIYTSEDILSSAGITLSDENEADKENENVEEEISEPIEKEQTTYQIENSSKLENKSIEELEIELNNAISREDYEIAAKIKGIIDSKK
jgi:uncharacterized protein